MTETSPLPPASDVNAPSNADTTAPVAHAVVATGLTKRYGQLRAVDNIDLVVPRGAVFGLIGPNGAGKSTLMAMAASLLIPTSGSIVVEGHHPVADPQSVRAAVGYMPDGLGVYEGMNVAEYLDFFAAAHRIPAPERPALSAGLLELVELDVKHDAAVNSLSRGMKQRLSLARALVHDPAVLILDEPASGLDPRARVELRHLISNLNAMGKTIIVSSHILTELQEVCTHIGIMEAGRVLAAGSPEAILAQTPQNPEVHVSFADGTRHTMALPDGYSLADFLRHLVINDPREVIAYAPADADLESVFMSVTEGIVQ